MKKLLAIAISAAALSAMAETVTGSNEIGTLEITSTHKKTVVAVPFNTLGTDATSIKPSDLVLNTNLVEGDQIYVFGYDANGKGSYKGWVLDNSAAWTAVDNSEVGSDGTPKRSKADGNTTVPLGSGFWLVRNSSYVEGTSFKFYIYGQYTNVTSTITANAYNLIANPKSTAVTFNFDGAKGDYLIVPNGEKPKRYEYDGSKWYTKGSNAGPVVQPGQGFWYVSAGGGSGSYAW